MREAGVKAEGVIVDLHVVRVAPRIGIAEGTDPKKIEKQIMEALPQKEWGEAGMAISFLGREICRPSDPQHHNCVMAPSCSYFNSIEKKKPAKKAAPAKAVPAKKTVAKAAKKKVVKKSSAKAKKK
jgi:endonuclease-3